MGRKLWVLLLLLGFWAPASAASAGVYSDDLGKCLVRTSTPQDKVDLMVWFFTSVGLHPAVKSYSRVTQADEDATAMKAGALFTRLLTADCHSETIAALKYEGQSALETAFSLLGQVAVQELMHDPSVEKATSHIVDYMDKGKFAAMAKEAGVAP